MSKNVKNKLKNVNIGGNYVGGDHTDHAPAPDSPKQKWVIAVVVALIGMAGVIIAALIKAN